MQVSMIVAMARNRVIGLENRLPWHLPADLKHFRAITLGKPVIMGRRTYESIGRPLPGRLNIVVSRGQPALPEGVLLAPSVEAAVAIAQSQGAAEAMIIGGDQIYQLGLPLAVRLYLTLVDAEVAGDAWFPDWQAAGQWREVAREAHAVDEQHAYPYAFVTLEKV